MPTRPEWRQLVDHVAALDEPHPESLAFSLMKIRLNGCLECETDPVVCKRLTTAKNWHTQA